MAIENPHTQGPGQQVEAASRSSRFLARLIDGLIWFAPLPLLLLPCLGALGAVVLLLAIFFGQLWLLVTRGQTLGKQAMKIYIMREDGELANVGWLLLREFAIPAAVLVLRLGGRRDPSVLGQAFQALLGFVWLIDVLFIFGGSRRCLHDYVAGTHVVKAE